MIARSRASDSPGLVGLARPLLAHWLRRARLAASVRRLHGPGRPPGGPRDVVALSFLRDGEDFLPHFLRHHRRIGVRHFVFLENGSTDRGLELLRRETDVTVLRTRLPFASYRHHFKRLLIRAAGRKRWSLFVEIDDWFDFPGSDRIALPTFCAYLEKDGYTAVAAHRLDLFPRGPVLRPPPDGNGNLLQVHRYFDLTDIRADEHEHAFGKNNYIADPAIKCLSCGVRNRVSGNEVLLTRHPLVRWGGNIDLPRHSHDISHARVADVSCVLLHFDLMTGFAQTIERLARQDGNGDESASARQRRLAEARQTHPGPGSCGPTTRELRSLDDLVETGFLRVSPAYRHWLDMLAPRRRKGRRAIAPRHERILARPV